MRLCLSLWWSLRRMYNMRGALCLARVRLTTRGAVGELAMSRRSPRGIAIARQETWHMKDLGPPNGPRSSDASQTAAMKQYGDYSVRIEQNKTSRPRRRGAVYEPRRIATRICGLDRHP